MLCDGDAIDRAWSAEEASHAITTGEFIACCWAASADIRLSGLKRIGGALTMKGKRTSPALYL